MTSALHQYRRQQWIPGSRPKASIFM